MTHNTVVLESDRVRLEIVPGAGARVVALVDKLTGRNWLTTGDIKSGAGDDAVYDGEISRGWDECFPTIGRCRVDAWGGGLRDHGVLWGRPWQCTEIAGAIECHYAGDGFLFTRRLALKGDRLAVDYCVEATGQSPLSWIWSQHCLLACEPGEAFDVSGLATPVNDAGEVADLRPVRGMEAGFAQKTYARCEGEVRVGISGPKGSLHLSWNAASIAFCGVWLDYGAWPKDNPVHQLAFEPATAACDHLSTAIERGVHEVLQPGAKARWALEVTVG